MNPPTLPELIVELQSPSARFHSFPSTSLLDAWKGCLRADWMLWTLHQLGYRKERTQRRFAVACARRHCDYDFDPRFSNLLQVAEQFALGETHRAALAKAHAEARVAAEQYLNHHNWTLSAAAAQAAVLQSARHSASDAAQGASQHALRSASWDSHQSIEAEQDWQVGLIHIVFDEDFSAVLLQRGLLFGTLPEHAGQSGQR